MLAEFQIDHIAIRTRDVAGTQEFFSRVFGLAVGERAAERRRIPGCWLYSGDRPVVHIIGSHGFGIDHAAEAFDHVSFRLTDIDGFLNRLDRLGIRYTTADREDYRERSVFLRAPGGPLLEVLFDVPARTGDDSLH
jgi:catechol 2,3-dioxygenase-like lactoylglutathione lyase family enzyme